MTEVVTVTELGRELAFGFEDMNRYHGGGSPASVATAFKVLQRAFAVLSPLVPPPRRSVVISKAFRGPGARDGLKRQLAEYLLATPADRIYDIA